MKIETRKMVRPDPEPFFTMWRADMDRHYVYFEHVGFRKKFALLFMNHALWAQAAYRFGRRLKTKPVPVLQPVLWAKFRVWEWWTRILSGTHLDVDARIGPGLYIGHFGFLHVGAGVEIGRDCSIGHLCYVGPGGPEGESGAPVIGDRVYLGVGSKVIGGIRIGDDAALGANAVALEDVPDHAVLVGNPGTVVSDRGSGDYIRLRNKPTG